MEIILAQRKQGIEKYSLQDTTDFQIICKSGSRKALLVLSSCCCDLGVGRTNYSRILGFAVWELTSDVLCF